jgi:cytochrome c oxidase cbb3-type subunit 1
MNLYSPEETRNASAPHAVAGAAWHALFWLVVANAAGVLIAILLLFPALNPLLGEWTYGRWIMLHMNLELYGWTSLPLAGFLFRVYGADRGVLAAWCRPVLWAWSAALGVGAFSWLSGHSSGKLFLDWSGTGRIFFPLAMMALWMLLAAAYKRGWNFADSKRRAGRITKLAGLFLLLLVPVVLYVASGPGYFLAAINPVTGGPTGASQLESSLMIVAILLLLPYGIAQRKEGSSRTIAIAWALLGAESLLCLALGRGDASSHLPAQYLSLGSLLAWIPLTPSYYASFSWHSNTRRWRTAFLAWWITLILTGWIFFLPGILDHFKFTDGLVGHSFIAMAGFTSSLLIFVLVQLLGEGGWVFNRTRSFYAWQTGVLAYIVVMTAAGWREGFDPAFTIVPGAERELLYSLRLAAGVLMLTASLDWLVDVSALLRALDPLPITFIAEKAA